MFAQGLRAQWAKGLTRRFAFCPRTMSPLGLGIRGTAFPRAPAACARDGGSGQKQRWHGCGSAIWGDGQYPQLMSPQCSTLFAHDGPSLAKGLPCWERLDEANMGPPSGPVLAASIPLGKNWVLRGDSTQHAFLVPLRALAGCSVPQCGAPVEPRCPLRPPRGV